MIAKETDIGDHDMNALYSTIFSDLSGKHPDKYNYTASRQGLDEQKVLRSLQDPSTQTLSFVSQALKSRGMVSPP